MPVIILIGERPDAILNIVDGTNLERNLYLTTQLTELGIPVVMAVNMMDMVRKERATRFAPTALAKELGCPVVEISALKGDGVMEAAETAIQAAKNGKTIPMHSFSGPVEHAIAHIEEAALHSMPQEQQRWYAIKLFERDEKVTEQLEALPNPCWNHIEEDIAGGGERAGRRRREHHHQRALCVHRLDPEATATRRSRRASSPPPIRLTSVVTNRWAGSANLWPWSCSWFTTSP